MAEMLIDLQAIKNNILHIKRLLNNNQKLCMVAKANCYGFGSKKLCEFADTYVDYFAVSSADEFFDIKNFVKKPVLILEPIYENITKVAVLGGELSVSNLQSLEKVIDCAEKNSNVIFKIHLVLNTGMNRFGFSLNKDLLRAINKIKKVQNISICGVFSHFFAGNEEKFAINQYNEFLKITNNCFDELEKQKIIFHLCNTAGLEVFNCFDMVRIGMKIYDDSKFSTVTLKAKILDLQNLKAGECVGYGVEFVAKKDMTVAVVGIGYADGIMRNIVKNGYVLIKDFKAKIIAICMDCLMVDVSGFFVEIYDDVVIVGRSGKNQIFVCDVARWCDTISYEIISRISQRVKRKYIG